MKRQSNLSRRYVIYRKLPFLVPNNDPITGMTLNTVNLVRPTSVRFVMEGLGLEVIQRISKEQRKNENWIKDSLKKEAYRIFEIFSLEEVIIKLNYE